MPQRKTPSSRTHLAVRIALYATVDLFGLFCLALGASWFIAGKGVFMANFPSAPAEAAAAAGGGLATMAWAATRLLQALRRQRDDLPLRHTPDGLPD